MLSTSAIDREPIRDHMVTTADAFRAHRLVGIFQSIVGCWIKQMVCAVVAFTSVTHVLKDMGRVAKRKVICSTAVALIRRADFIFDILAFGLQVTSLALCKVNKSEMLLRRLNQHFRHERTEELFWKNNEVPAEALKILQVSFSQRRLECVSA